MFKRIRGKLMEKFFGCNPILEHMLRNGFKDHPVGSIILSLYMFPVRNILKPSDEKLFSQHTFKASPQYYSELQDLLHIGRVEGFGFVRSGRDYDGGYIMLDDFHAGNIAYSFGISDDVSWDRDVASRGCDVFMYDHTIDGLPEENPRFHWSKLGIGDGSGKDDRLKTLEELISRNGHEDKRDMILKMDVEGAEWGFLDSVKPETLAQFSQIIFELHDITRNPDSDRVLRVLRKLNKTHQLVHIHPNNARDHITIGGKNFSALIEVLYVLRDKYEFTADDDVKLPLEIDKPNTKKYPEVELGLWNKKAKINDTFTLTAKVFY